MALTLGLTGMDPATETALKAAFADASARAGGMWRLVPEPDASHVMVDMDSLYGPMSWLRLHAAGKHVIGLTTAPRTQTDFRLGRPFDTEGFAGLLRDIAAESGVEVVENNTHDAAGAGASAKIIASFAAPMLDSDIADHDVQPPPAPVDLAPAAPSGMTPAPAPSDALSMPTSAQLPAPVDVRESVHAFGAAAALQQATTPMTAETPTAPQARGLAAWLASNALPRRVRYRRQTGPNLLIDTTAQLYHGPSTLKPLAAYFQGDIARQDFEAVDDVSWARESSSAGAAQPLQRLEWLAALVEGREALANEPADTRFKLDKWPQTEREYPKHFRIATAMMKGAATLSDISQISGMPADDVADFVNASLATGFAERVTISVPDASDTPARSGGLLGRLRGR